MDTSHTCNDTVFKLKMEKSYQISVLLESVFNPW